MNLRTQIIRGQAVSWFLVLLLSGVVFVSIQQSLTSAEQRRQALAQLTQIEVIKTDALDLETGMRGYLLTADTQFLEPFDRARASFGQDIDAERALIPTDGKSAEAARTQSVMLDTIQAQVNLWLVTVADPAIDNVKGNANMAVNIPLQARGKEMIDQVRSTVETYRGDETAILNGRINAAYRMLTILKVVTGIGLLGVVVSSLLSGLWLAGAMTKPMARLVHGAQRLADGALDERVAVSGARELRQVARAFNEMAEKLQASQVDLAGQNAILSEQASTLARSSAIEHTFSDVLRAFTASYDRDAILKDLLALLAERHGFLVGAVYRYDEWSGAIHRRRRARRRAEPANAARSARGDRRPDGARSPDHGAGGARPPSGQYRVGSRARPRDGDRPRLLSGSHHGRDDARPHRPAGRDDAELPHPTRPATRHRPAKSRSIHEPPNALRPVAGAAGGDREQEPRTSNGRTR